jgi:hypothetical protein
MKAKYAKTQNQIFLFQKSIISLYSCLLSFTFYLIPHAPPLYSPIQDSEIHPIRIGQSWYWTPPPGGIHPYDSGWSLQLYDSRTPSAPQYRADSTRRDERNRIKRSTPHGSRCKRKLGKDRSLELCRYPLQAPRSRVKRICTQSHSRGSRHTTYRRVDPIIQGPRELLGVPDPDKISQ